MPRTDVSRRAMLRRGSTILGTGLVGIAGCVGRQADDRGTTRPGTSESDGSATPTGSPTRAPWTGPAFGRWLPAPGTAVPDRPYLFWALALTEFAEHLGGLPRNTRQAIDAAWGPLPLDWRSVPTLLMFPAAHVIMADINRTAVVGTVTDAGGWSEAGTYEGYTVIEPVDEGRTLAISDGVVVTARGFGADRPPTATARGIIDTRLGRMDRYPGVNASLDALIAAFGDGFIRHWRPRAAFGERPQDEATFDGQVGLGRHGEFIEGTTAAVEQYYVFERAEAVDLDAVQDFVSDRRGEGGQFAAWSDVTYRQEGRLAVVQGTVTRPR